MAILITEKTKIEKAVEKARKVKPQVHVTGFGTFHVTGSQGERYIVTFSGTRERLVGDCTCPGGKSGRACCYHLASTYPIWKLQIKERAAARAASSSTFTLDCPRCNCQFGTENRYAFFCPPCEALVEAEDLATAPKCRDCQQPAPVLTNENRCTECQGEYDCELLAG